MLIMPYSHDQPDNARRMRRLGVSRVIQRATLRAVRAWRARCERCWRSRSLPCEPAKPPEVARENGVKTACDALEALNERQGSGLRDAGPTQQQKL